MNDQIMFLSAPYVHVHVIYDKVRQYYIHVLMYLYSTCNFIQNVHFIVVFERKGKGNEQNINLRYILQMESTGSEV